MYLLFQRDRPFCSLAGAPRFVPTTASLPAVLHKVDDDIDAESRMSAVLFCAPKKVETLLEPVVRPGEKQQYIGGIKVGHLRGKMARKWRYREGTLSEDDRVLEEEEIRMTDMTTQDHVVERLLYSSTIVMSTAVAL